MAEVQYQEEVPYRAPNMHRRSGNSRLRVEGDNGPIRSTYDVSNTSTQLILLNNKYPKDVNRLRGQSARSRSIVVPDPIRHFLSESPIDRKTHEQCFNTSSPGHSEMDNYHRHRFTQGYIPVNTNRHAACVGPQTIDINQRPRTRHRVLSEKVLSKSVAYCPDLTKGEKLYLYNISRVYSTKNLHAINQRKYATVLSQEEQTGRYNQRDIDKYWNYIRSPRQTSWGSGKSSFTPKRTKSAPPGKQRKRQLPQRPETRLERREFSDDESQDTPRGNQEQQTPRKEKGIIETVLAETDDRKSDTGSHRSRGSKRSDRSKARRSRSASRSSSSSRSRNNSSSSSSSRSIRRYSSNDTGTKHKRASDSETLVQRAKDESQSKESDTQESRATDNEMTTRPDVRASDTADEDTSRGKKEGYSSMSDSRGNDAHLREGYGRPKSRFGRTGANKEDDYDSDSSSTTTKSSSSSTHSSNSDKSNSNKQKKSSKKPMARIEEQTKIEVTKTTTKDESCQQKESDTSVSESKDQSQITTTTDHSISMSHNNESEGSQKKKAVKKKVTRSRYMESRPTRTNSESSLTQSIASNKSSSDKPNRQRKSSRSSIKSNRSGKEEKKSKVKSSTKLENVTEDGEQKRSKTPYKSITLESKLKSENGDLPSNHKDVNKIEY